MKLLLFIKQNSFVIFLVVLTALPFFSYAQPSNDNCINAISRNSNTNCNSSNYRLRDATASIFTISGTPCVVGTHYDVWFSFTAQGIDQTATISNLGSSVTNPEVAIFSGTCAGTLTQLACGTTSATASGLTIGVVYFVRVSNVGAAITNNNDRFDLCIIHYNPPANNECSASALLTSGSSCNNTESSIQNATASSFTISGTPCVVGTHYDVWYRFVAVGVTQTATISSLESGFTNPEVAIFSGSCAGTLTQLGCGSTTTTVTGLTIGTTYYVRVSNVGSLVTSSNSDFDICIFHQPAGPTNDFCTTATTLTPASACNTVTGNLRYSTSVGPVSPGGSCPISGTPTYDVWYTFVATSTTHAATVSNLGSNLTAANTYIQLFSGACGSLVSLGCQPVSTTNGRITNTALTIGATYYIRIYVTTNPIASPANGWDFRICLQQPPPNDLCAGAVSLTPGASCSNIGGTLDLTLASVLPGNGCVAAGTYYDVWYRFTATSISHTITLSAYGSNFTAPRIIMYTAAGCPVGAPLTCVSAYTLTQATVIGTVYYVQIANFGVNPSGVNAANFNICITAAAAPPSNDVCSGAVTLISGTTCSNVSGTIINATASAPVVPGSCGNATAPDVWFSFVAQSAFPVINLSAIGANLQTNGRVQLLTGACGSFVQVGTCHSIPAAANTSFNTISNPGGDGLIIGQTYYIRITHNTLVAPVTSGTYTFNICVVDPTPVARSIIDYAKSYVNLTDSTGGGTINPGDILEIRATLVIRNTAGAKTIDSVAFYDTLVAGSGLELIDNSIATRTNEGKLFQSFTASSLDADAGWYTTAGVGFDTLIRINLGSTTVPTATRTNKTSLSNSSRPNLFTNTACIVMATYRVRVTAAYGTKINFGGGSILYRDQSSGGFGVKIEFPKDSLIIYESATACPDNVVQTNILGDEFNGTFGTAATSAIGNQNRGTSPNTTYQYQAFSAPSSGPNDYFYAVANNTSTNHTVVRTVPKPTAAPPRLFGHWDISGDHTSASNNYNGNTPCNPGLPVSATNPCGYMLVVNAAYRTDVAFTFNVSAACPNTYYEISSWVKSVCYRCGCDVNGVPSNGVGYQPSGLNVNGAGLNDSSGVKPNLAYEINGVDYYTTGNISYAALSVPGVTNSTSDSLNGWVRRAFVYRTGPSETNFTITIRNNAPGGGGNDWALDDITLRTCLPTFEMSPTNNPTYCNNGSVNMAVRVQSNYNSYVYYQWERSTDGGVNWGPAPELPGVQTFTYTYDGVSYKDTVVYPTIIATAAINGYQYRIKTASTISNLSSNSCAVANSNDIITITVGGNCNVLPNEILKFNVQLNSDKALLTWKIKEEDVSSYEIEKSSDGVNFNHIGTVNATGITNSETSYSFTDPVTVAGKVYYRLKIKTTTVNTGKYSNTLSVSLFKNNNLEISNLVNPFHERISFQLNAVVTEAVMLQLTDALGHPLVNKKLQVFKGGNAIAFEVPGHFARGSYLLRIVSASGSIYKIVQKQ